MRTSLRNAVGATVFLVATAMLLGIAKRIFNQEHSVGNLVLLVIGFILFQVCSVIWSSVFKVWWRKWRHRKSQGGL